MCRPFILKWPLRETFSPGEEDERMDEEATKHRGWGREGGDEEEEKEGKDKRKASRRHEMKCGGTKGREEVIEDK